jgi:hypothetical protein
MKSPQAPIPTLIHKRVQQALTGLKRKPDLSLLALSSIYQIPFETAARIKRENDVREWITIGVPSWQREQRLKRMLAHAAECATGRCRRGRTNALMGCPGSTGIKKPLPAPTISSAITLTQSSQNSAPQAGLRFTDCCTD